MALTQEEQATLADMAAGPPANFNLDYAKIVLALRESQKPEPLRSRIDRATMLVALITSVIAVIASGVTAFTTYSDRIDKASEQTFNNQVSMTKIYFDKFAGAEPKTSCPDLALFVEAALTMASMDDAKAEAASLSTAPPDDKDGHAGERRLALVLYKELKGRRLQHFCDSVVHVVPTANPNGVADVQPGGAADAASYRTAPLPATSSPNPQSISVYIQVPAGSDKAFTQANAFKKILASSVAFHVSSIERVQAVPNHDQIRMYRADDVKLAAQLKQLLGLPNAQIVNLQSAYPNLPNHVMEVWLARAGSDGTTPSDLVQ